MPLPCPSGTISLLDIQTEFGGANPAGINEYYRNGSYVPSSATTVPISGQISFSDFFCTQKAIIINKYITSESTNVSASSYFTTEEWASSAIKILTINSGVIVGSTSVSNYALTIPSGLGGSFKLINNGSIQGAGGSTNGGNGGNAILASSSVSIENNGTIYAGGGGGGKGDTGTASSTHTTTGTTLELTQTAQLTGGLGQGYKQTKTTSTTGAGRNTIKYTSTSTRNYTNRFPPNSDITITNSSSYTNYMYFSSNSNITVNQTSSGVGNIGLDGCIWYRGSPTSYCTSSNANKFGLGGIIMSGSNSSIRVSLSSSGVYELKKDPSASFTGTVGGPNYTPNTVYNLINQTGLTDQTANQVTISNYYSGTKIYTMPSVTGNTTDGAGGDWGTNGSNGTTGNGGAAGYYIVNNSNVTWLATGTRLGRVG